MGASVSRAAARLQRPAAAAAAPAAFPPSPAVPPSAAAAAAAAAPLVPKTESEQAVVIESLLNQATITTEVQRSHGDAPIGMLQRNKLVGQLGPLELHQSLALHAQDPQKWSAAAIAARFEADPELLHSALENCTAYCVVTGADRIARAERYAPVPGSTDFWDGKALPDKGE